MGTDDAKKKVLDAARVRGQQLDETVGKVGAEVEDKVAPIADKAADKAAEMTERSSDRDT